jgi:2-polyprenyl-3-methyl-5-hydroxy-6-metoxy-1,4-benzoquinol methylase
VISHLKGTSILDAGCGNGWLSVCAWEEGFSVYAVDVSENDIKECQFISKKQNADIALTRTSLLGLPFLDFSFDSIMCICVLEHISSIERALLEIKRVLRNHGRLIIVVPNGLTYGLFYDKFVYRLVPIKLVLSRSCKKTFLLTNREMSTLNLDRKEADMHEQQLTLSRIRRLINENGFRVDKIVNCKFLSPYLRSLCALVGSEPLTAFEAFDDKLAELIPQNLAAEWAIICEKKQ